MQQRRVGHSGLHVSRLGLGTLTWGRDTDEHEAREQLEAFLDAGGTLVDTASSYGDGAAEDVLGGLLRALPAAERAAVVLAGAAGVDPPGAPPGSGTSRRTLLATLDASLRRLGADHLDVWQLQAWGAPPEEALGALDAAVGSGRARYAGLGDVSGWQLGWAAAVQAGAGPVAGWPGGAGRAPVTSAAVELSLLRRGAEADVLPGARALGVGVLAWAPLARGVLTGKYRGGTPADSRLASAHFATVVEPYVDSCARRVVEAVCTAADGLGVAPAEVALAWARDVRGVASAVVGARTAAQLRAVLRVEDVELPAQIRAVLDEVSAPAGATAGS